MIRTLSTAVGVSGALLLAGCDYVKRTEFEDLKKEVAALDGKVKAITPKPWVVVGPTGEVDVFPVPDDGATGILEYRCFNDNPAHGWIGFKVKPGDSEPTVVSGSLPSGMGLKVVSTSQYKRVRMTGAGCQARLDTNP